MLVGQMASFSLSRPLFYLGAFSATSLEPQITKRSPYQF